MEMFWCKACKPCGEPKSKHKAQEHLVGQHGFPKAMVQSFLVVHDQHAIAKGRLSRCVLSECYARHIASNGVGRLEDGGREEAPPAPPWRNSRQGQDTNDEAPPAPPWRRSRQGQDTNDEAHDHLERADDAVPEHSGGGADGSAVVADVRPVPPWRKSREALLAQSGAQPKRMAAPQPTVLAPLVTNWAEALPKIAIRREYLECKPPSSRCDSITKAAWPIESFRRYKATMISNDTLAAFKVHLEQDKNNQPTTIADHVLAMQRLFHMLEVDGEPVLDEGVAASPKLMAALFVQDAHVTILRLPLVAPHLSWTRKLLEGALAYLVWQKKVVGKEQLKESAGPWRQYALALMLFHQELQGGYHKRVQVEKQKRLHDKRAEDFAKIQCLPSREEMRVGVRRAQLLLNDIEQRTKGWTCLPEKLQAVANSCLVGPLFVDGCAGRLNDWAQLLFAVVEAGLARGQTWLVCKNHKNSHLYGSLAKHLEPGALELLRCYMRLPRDARCKLLIVPPRAGTLQASIHKALWLFARDHLPLGREKPTSNLLRKLFHSILVEMTLTEAKLLEVLQIIEAHTSAVARKHYVLRNAAADAKLAQHMVKLAFGETVPWPNAREIEKCYPSGKLVLPTGGFKFDGKKLGRFVQEADAPDESLLVPWEFGRMFGVAMGPLALEDGIQPLALTDKVKVEEEDVEDQHKEADVDEQDEEEAEEEEEGDEQDSEDEAEAAAAAAAAASSSASSTFGGMATSPVHMRTSN